MAAAGATRVIKIVHVHHFVHHHHHTHQQDVPTAQFQRYQQSVQRAEQRALRRARPHQPSLPPAPAPVVHVHHDRCPAAPVPPTPAATSPRRIFTPFAQPEAAPFVRYHDRPRPEGRAAQALRQIMCCLESIWEALSPYLVPCANLALQVLDFVLSRTSIGFLLRPDWRAGTIATS